MAKHPPARPVEDEIGAVIDAIARLKRAIDRLHSMAPGPFYERAMRYVNRTEDAIEAWRRLESL